MIELEEILNKRILELGAGIGICSIFCEKLGGKVTCTDKLDTLELIRHNSEINKSNLEIQEYM